MRLAAKCDARKVSVTLKRMTIASTPGPRGLWSVWPSKVEPNRLRSRQLLRGCKPLWSWAKISSWRFYKVWYMDVYGLSWPARTNRRLEDLEQKHNSTGKNPASLLHKLLIQGFLSNASSNQSRLRRHEATNALELPMMAGARLVYHQNVKGNFHNKKAGPTPSTSTIAMFPHRAEVWLGTDSSSSKQLVPGQTGQKIATQKSKRNGHVKSFAKLFQLLWDMLGRTACQPGIMDVFQMVVAIWSLSIWDHPRFENDKSQLGQSPNSENHTLVVKPPSKFWDSADSQPLDPRISSFFKLRIRTFRQTLLPAAPVVPEAISRASMVFQKHTHAHTHTYYIYIYEYEY